MGYGNGATVHIFRCVPTLMSGELWPSRHVCVFAAQSDITEWCAGCGATRMIDDGRNNPDEIERRARAMAREHAANSPQLQHWTQQGNKLPTIYR